MKSVTLILASGFFVILASCDREPTQQLRDQPSRARMASLSKEWTAAAAKAREAEEQRFADEEQPQFAADTSSGFAYSATNPDADADIQREDSN